MGGEVYKEHYKNADSILADIDCWYVFFLH
jgi:hypothetical protein